MNRDDYDDDLDQYDEDYIDDDEDTEDEQPDIVPDGGRVRVPIFAMDAVQKAIHDASPDIANHRPGWRVPPRIRDQDQVVADAHAEYVRYLRDAHRTPGVSKETPAKRRPRSLADSQAAAEQAYEERSAWLRDAYKQRPGYTPSPPVGSARYGEQLRRQPAA